MQVWPAALYVLAGFADGERPRRPRSSWVFGCGVFEKYASLSRQS